MLSREEQEQNEVSLLVSYAMKAQDSLGRDSEEEEHPYRTAFQRDRDRIIHSKAFRLLEYKTQVFVNHEGDEYRTRLTHTLEVAQIGRTLARTLRLNEDLTETLALAHDLGHTPFGHSGEKALNDLMADIGGFEHNSHGVRVVELLERRYPGFPGLNLSWEVRESMRKHETKYDSPVKHNYKPEWKPLLEGQIVDIADSIAYDNHDLDDGLQAGLISASALKKDIKLWAIAEKEVMKKNKQSNPDLLLSQIILYLINMEVTDLINNTDKRISDFNINSVEDVRNCEEKIVKFSDELTVMRKELEEFLYENLYKHYRVVRMAQKAEKFIKELFNAYCENRGQLPPKYQAWADEVGDKRAICDYIAGMTDRFAQKEYRKLFDPFEIV